MSVIESDVLGSFSRSVERSVEGPVTAARRRRNLKVYFTLVALGLIPGLTGMSAGLQAFGLGLLLPGAGFIAHGAGGLLILGGVLGLFWLSCIAWFWAGMVVAPVGVWLGAALVAGATAGATAWPPAMFLAPLAAVLVFGGLHFRSAQRQARDRAIFEQRKTYYQESRDAVEQRVQEEPVTAERELTLDQLKSMRWVFDRALQPIGEYEGYTIIDQFQPAALRYQINHFGYALSLMQRHYTPSFSGYLGQAQRNLIETTLDPKVWSYWVLESMWGHLNFSDFDPCAKDNVMLTGYFGMQVNAYMLASGDRRYGEPGSLTFRLNERTAYEHDSHTIAKSVLDNFERSDFCLYPCEPNWIYPVCNMYGMASLASHDAVFSGNDVASVLPNWMTQLQTEFSDEKGSLVGLRSYWTGHAISIFNGEAGFAFFANVFSPELARRLWAIGRAELGACVVDDGQGNPRITIPREAMALIDTIDVGNYRPGMAFVYDAIAICGREFGDTEIAEAAERSLDQDCGRVENHGVVHYAGASGMANGWTARAKISRTGDFRNTFISPPPDSVARGPQLTEASYPDVLVAKAYSHGDDLELVLYPGRQSGSQSLTVERLEPGRGYTVEGNDQGILFTADAGGTAKIEIRLDGRTVAHIRPQ